jgi:uncharacterized membrane protein (UPF0136 family)
MSNLERKIVFVEKEDTIGKVIGFLRSKSGHALLVGIMSALLCVLTAVLFAETMKGIRGWEFVGIITGIMFALGLEFGIFFLAINGYKTASFICAGASIIIARATFAEFQNSNDWFSAKYAALWIMSLFPPLLVAFVSHKMSEKFELEALAAETNLKTCKVCEKPCKGDYCSPKCKQKAYRHRKEVANE